MKERNNFKQTEIGLIPEDCQVVRLGDYIERCVEKNRESKQLPVYTVSNKLGFILSDDFFDKRVYSKKLNTYKIVKGDYFAYNPYRINVGSLALSREKDEGLVSPAYVVFKVRDEKHCFLNGEFLLLILKSPEYVQKIRNISMSRGSVRRTLSLKDLNEFLIPLPPLPEQRKIARVLSTIQRAIEQQDKIIEATKRLKKSLMQKLFSEGLNGEEQKETEIGLIPKSWEMVRLGEVVEKTRQTDLGKNPDDKFKYIDVSGISNTFFQIVEFKEYFGKDAPSRARKLIKTDDIIVATVRPYLKRVAIVPRAFDSEVCSTAFCVIRCKKNAANPIFVFNYLVTDAFMDKVAELQRGSSYPAVTDKDVLNREIPLPPLPEQQEIAHILSAVDKKIEVEGKRKATLKKLFKIMLHKLMTGEIRVKDVEI